MDITKEDLAGFDAVVDAFGTFAPDTLDLHTKSLMHLSDAVANTDTRLLVVGGAGSLFVDKEHTTQLLDTPEFPKEFYALAKAQADELAELRKRNDVKWTFVSPAAILIRKVLVPVNTFWPVKNSLLTTVVKVW